MKKFISGVVMGTILTTAIGAGAAGIWDKINVLKNDITVIVNGENVTADNFVYNDTTYLPLRAVSEALGQPVDYDETTNTAYIGEKKEVLEVKSKYTPPEDIINDRNYILFDNGIYYITGYFLDQKGVKWDYDKGMNCTLTLPNGVQKEYQLSYSGIPYDFYVEEIEPLLK